MGFAREVIGGGGEGTVRALTKRRMRRLKLDVLVRNPVKRANTGSARVEVAMLPCCDVAVGVDPGPNIYDSGGAKVSVSKFFLALSVLRL